jgi:hypothetical protein
MIMSITVEILSDSSLPPEFDWAAVVAAAYWPGDYQAREDFLAHIRLSYVARIIPADHAKDILLAATEATPFSTVQGRIKRCLYPALQAGGYFHETVALSHLRMKYSMKRLADLMVSGLGGMPGAADTPRQFENHVWPTYRPVAHLWAAYLHRSMDEIDDAPPCSVKALPEFLSLAEGFRVLGLKTKTQGQGKDGESRTLLSPGESAVLPDSIRVPPPTTPSFDISNYSSYDYSFDRRE